MCGHAYAHTHQIFHCSHTQRMEVEEGSDYKSLDCQNGRLRAECAHMRYVPESRALAQI